MLSKKSIFTIITIPLIISYFWPSGKPQSYSKMGSGEMFNNIAPFYDLTNTLMSFGQDTAWRATLANKVLDHIDEKFNKSSSSWFTMVDVATGTGEVLFEVADRLKHPSFLVGIDPSSGMLSVAKNKAKLRGENNSTIELDFIEGPGEEISQYIPGRSTNVVSISFGIRNVGDRSKTILEFVNILKPGGIALILEFSLPNFTDELYGDNSNFLSRGVVHLANFFVSTVIPYIGSFGNLGHSFEEYAYLAKSIKEFPKPTEFVKFVKIASDGQLQFKSITNFMGGVVNLYEFEMIPIESL